MSRKHIQVKDCLASNGRLSIFCGCHHCALAVCDVCGAYEGGLTTECPGERVSYDRQEEVYQTDLDYTVEKGWYHSGWGMKLRAPLFEVTAETITDAMVSHEFGITPLPGSYSGSFRWTYEERVQAVERYKARLAAVESVDQ